MKDKALSQQDLRTIKECLRAAAEGPFFPDWEIETLFGVGRDQITEIATEWPDVEMSAEEVRLTVSNALANLTGYPHGEEEAWEQYISVSRSEVAELLRRWRERDESLPTI